MGEALVREFDGALCALLRPFARDGMLELDVATEVTWGAPRATPRSA